MREAIGARLKVLREREGFSMRGLAADAGISLSTLSEIEAGRGNPSAETLEKLSAAIGYLLCELVAIGESELEQLVDDCDTLTDRQLRELRTHVARMKGEK